MTTDGMEYVPWAMTSVFSTHDTADPPRSLSGPPLGTPVQQSIPEHLQDQDLLPGTLLLECNVDKFDIHSGVQID